MGHRRSSGTVISTHLYAQMVHRGRWTGKPRGGAYSSLKWPVPSHADILQSEPQKADQSFNHSSNRTLQVRVKRFLFILCVLTSLIPTEKHGNQASCEGRTREQKPKLQVGSCSRVSRFRFMTRLRKGSWCQLIYSQIPLRWLVWCYRRESWVLALPWIQQTEAVV